jgi:hypothetical protein
MANAVDFAFGADGLHAAYTASLSYYYARPDGLVGWAIETVSGPTGTGTGLALAPDGTVHLLAMVENSTGYGQESWALHRAERSSSAKWTGPFSVDGYVRGSDRIRVATDGAGRVQALYSHAICSGCDIATYKRLVRGELGTWSGPSALDSGLNGMFDLAAPTDAAAHVVAGNVFGGLVEHVLDGTTAKSPCPACPKLDGPPSVAVGAGGSGHAIYGGSAPVLASNGPSGWSTSYVPIETLGAAHGIAVDRAGGVHVAYLDGTALKYGHRCP